MPTLYDEAIADARALKEMAERNARNKIIESISPQIRRMVERQILSEQEDEAGDEAPNLDLEPLPDEPVADVAAAPEAPMMGGAPAPDPDEEVTHTVTTKTASGTEVKINVRVDKHGEASASADSDVAEGDDVDVSLNKEGLEALADMVLGERRQERASLGKLRRQFESLKSVSAGLPLSESVNFRAAYSILVKNMGDFRNHLISNGGTREVKKGFNSIVKEMIQMSNSARFRRLLEEMEGRKPRLRKEAKIVFDPTDLEGLEDEDFKTKLQGMTFGVEFGEAEAGAEGGEMPVDVADTGAGAPADAAAAPPAPPAPSEYDMSEDMEYEGMDDEHEGMDHDDMMDEMYDELEEDDSMEEGDDDMTPEGATFHVDESMLRRELRRLRESKGGKGIANPMASNFGGGKAVKHPVKDKFDLNVNEGDEPTEADAVAEKALKVAKKATDVAKGEREARIKEARANRDLKSKLDESERANAVLREQLEEVNLFNAKLLYVNKLMQNRDLTPRQQRAVVESLDSAKSVREAKLLFTSLTESLKSKSGTVNEGRILGSSSRSTRSASPAGNLNESVEVDRWAILAGIKSGK
jgi:hypothetical protein